MNAIVRFFDLYSQDRDPQARAQGITDNDLTGWRQLCVYLACFVGVVLGPHALAAAAGHFPPWATVFDSWSRIIWALIFAFVLTAGLFKLRWIGAKTPLVIQIGVALAVGLTSSKTVPLVLKFFSKAPTSGD